MSTSALPLFKHSGVNIPEPDENSNPLNESLDKEISQDSPSYDGWIPSSESATVAGREIGGMVYVGTKKSRTQRRDHLMSNAYINASLPVAEPGSYKADRSFDFWSTYQSISPVRRAGFLDWLAAGRSDASFEPNFILMFLYGLERRFSVDDPPDAEKYEILDEAVRLDGFNHDNFQVKKMLNRFILLARLKLGEFSQIEPIYENDKWELPFSVKAAIGAYIARRERLPAEWFLSWFYCHPSCRLKLPARRCHDEFCELFKIRFDERFPKGYKVNKTKHVLCYHYYASSGEFRIDLDVKLNGQYVTDIAPHRKFLDVAQELADEVSMELSKFSRYIAPDPKNRSTLGARAFLPKELWLKFPCKKLDQLKKWARRVESKGGLVPVEVLVAKIERFNPDKITKQQLSSASIILAQTGFGFTPDPKFAFQAPKIGEPIAIFDTGDDIANVGYASKTYRKFLLTSALGAFVAHADGKVTESERKALKERVSSIKYINKHERRRLIADLEWMLSVAPKIALLRRKLKEFGPGVISDVRTALVSAAHADGVVRPQEVAAIEKVYEALGLNVSLVYSDLHASDMHDGIVTVRAAQPSESGETIVPERPAGAIQLDSERIASIHSDTEHVSSVLGEIFSEANDNMQNKYAQEIFVLGLDAKHAAFVKEIVSRQHWAEGAFKDLCGRHSFLMSGAIEDVNEWAFESYGDALLDEHEGYEVNVNIADELKNVFEGEGGSGAPGTA